MHLNGAIFRPDTSELAVSPHDAWMPIPLIVHGLRENPYIRPMTSIERDLCTGREAALPYLVQEPATGEDWLEPVRALVVPIRSLGESYRSQIERHLLHLDAHDRYLRFGFVANDEHIQRYAAHLDFERDEILGITNRKLELIAVAHLAIVPAKGTPECAEFGVSVQKSARGRGYGALLFERAAMDARNKGASRMLIHALSENTAMLRIARNAGAVIERTGADSEALLRLAPASLSSRMSAIVEDHYAQIDYRLKAQSKQLHDLLAAIKSWNQSWNGLKKGPAD